MYHPRASLYPTRLPEIPVIPDLEDDQAREDITQQVAAAPKNITRRVQSLAELEKDMQYALPAANTGLDLGLLTSALCPQTLVMEADERWEFSALLEVVSQELHTEQEAREADKAAADAAAALQDAARAKSAAAGRK